MCGFKREGRWISDHAQQYWYIEKQEIAELLKDSSLEVSSSLSTQDYVCDGNHKNRLLPALQLFQ